MSHTHLSQSTSRRNRAASLRGSRPRKLARLRHRYLQAERLEDRQLLTTISGAVFNDLNANGLKDSGESGQSGWTVYLDADGNGQLGTGETSATTAADGSYSFNGLAAGTYTVTEVLPLSWRQTAPVGITSPIERVSVATDGTEANSNSYEPSLSADGRYVAFSSFASNLVPGDTNGVGDIFVYDRETDTTERVSVASDGTQGNGQSFNPSVSADGRYVAFRSSATNLVPGADTNATYDVFVYDRQMHSIERVGLAADGTFEYATGNLAISADGRYVAFASGASNRVAGDTNETPDIFVYDRQMQTTERVNLAIDGTQSTGSAFSPSISADGRYVSFTSVANDLVSGDTNETNDIFVHDRVTGTTERVSVASDGMQGNGSSHGTYSPSMSADGRYVAFNSTATNLVPGDTNGMRDSFVYDRQTHTIERVNIASDGTQADNSTNTVSISADGRYVALDSCSNNLVPGDLNQTWDTFVYDRQTHTIKCVNVAADGTQGSNRTGWSVISADGGEVKSPRFTGKTDLAWISDICSIDGRFLWPRCGWVEA